MKDLVFITDSFPLGGITETPFIKKEIPYLKDSFNRIIIIPGNRYSKNSTSFIDMENVYVDPYCADNYKIASSFQLLNWIKQSVAIRSLFSDINIITKKQKLFSMLRYVRKAKFYADYIENLIIKGDVDPENTVFYSFWFMEATLALAILSEKYKISFYSRAHGIDMFDDRVTYRSYYIRDYTFSKIQHVWACSKCGSDYLCSKYPQWKDKISVSYLGCSKDFDGLNPQIGNPDEIVFLSCARMHHVKRLPMTLSLLAGLAIRYPRKKLSWIVVGDGEDRTSIENEIQKGLPSNFSIELRGALKNDKFQKILTEEHVDWGIMLSESEGFGLTICEMMSYGIPGIVSNVGGLPEVIGSDSGICLEKNPTCETLFASINYYVDNPDQYNQLRQNAHKRWSQHFNSDNLRKYFAHSISQ